MTKSEKRCNGPDCDRPAESMGFCGAHNAQRRRGRSLTPIGTVPPGPKKYAGRQCIFDPCDRAATVNDLCHTHNQQARRGGPLCPIGYRPPRPPRKCSECDRAAKKKGLCGTHYAQVWRYGSTHSIRASDGRRVDKNGYVHVKRPGHPEATDHGWGLEHRIVLSDMLDRALYSDESPHHRNGDREDNRPENLELWSRWQPAGQRVTDKVAYAKELLTRYEPEALAIEARKKIDRLAG